MARRTSGAGAGAAKKVWLISDEKLLALHRKLLKAVANVGRDGAGARRGLERYAAARVAVWFDLKRADMTLEVASASQLRCALDTATQNKERKNRRVVVAWGMNRKDGRAALERARARSLPIVFVGAAGVVGLSGAELSRTNGKLKPGEELPCITVDGHDVVAAYRVAHEAIERARRDRGPTLVLLETYEIAGKAFTDAVADMERYLEGRGLKAGTREQGSEKQGTRERGNKKAGT